MRKCASSLIRGLCERFRPELEEAIAELERLLKEEERDGEWAYQVNWFSRRVNLGVWQSWPEDTYITEKVLPLLERAYELVRATPHAGEHGEHVQHYANCLLYRLANVERYLRGEGALVMRASASKPEDIKITAL